MPITTVIFDWGCVLSLPPGPADYEPLRKALGVEAAIFQELYWRKRDPYDLDELDTPAYWGEIARAAGMTGSPEQIQMLATLDGQLWARTDPVMVEWVRVLGVRGFKKGILSNMSKSVGGHLLRTFKWLELFNHLCFSSDLKIGKPDPAIYRACLAGLRVPAPEALLIDDREVNITAARGVGMHGIVFRTAEQLLPELETYGLADSLAEAKTRAG
jgi:putative hydrolase of the HAD superfamily